MARMLTSRYFPALAVGVGALAGAGVYVALNDAVDAAAIFGAATALALTLRNWLVSEEERPLLAEELLGVHDATDAMRADAADLRRTVTELASIIEDVVVDEDQRRPTAAERNEFARALMRLDQLERRMDQHQKSAEQATTTAPAVSDLRAAQRVDEAVQAGAAARSAADRAVELVEDLAERIDAHEDRAKRLAQALALSVKEAQSTAARLRRLEGGEGREEPRPVNPGDLQEGDDDDGFEFGLDRLRDPLKKLVETDRPNPTRTQSEAAGVGVVARIEGDAPSEMRPETRPETPQEPRQKPHAETRSSKTEPTKAQATPETAAPEKAGSKDERIALGRALDRALELARSELDAAHPTPPADAAGKPLEAAARGDEPSPQEAASPSTPAKTPRVEPRTTKPPAALVRPLTKMKAAQASEEPFEVLLQPIFKLEDRTPAFFEAVSRERDEAGVLRAAADHVDAAKRDGSIEQLENRLFVRSVSVVDQLRRNGSDLGVFCNLSIDALRSDTFRRSFLAYLDINESLKERITLEFSQDEIGDVSDGDAQVLAEIRDAGFQFSLDHVSDWNADVGRLAGLGFQYIKLDATDLLQRQTNEGAELENLLDALGDLGVDLVVERIETTDQAAKLAGAGVVFGQGRALAAPRLVRLN